MTIAKQPIFGITYGPPKVGKTLAFIRAFPTALFISLPGAMSCASWLGIKVKHVVLKDIDQIIDAVKRAGKSKANYSAIILDDASIQFDAEFDRIKKKDSSWSGNRKFNEKIIELRDICRESPKTVWWNMHEQAPREAKAADKKLGKIIPGTVQCPGWQLPEKLPAMVDFVARVTYDDDAMGWPYVYQTAPDEGYITGDRLNISPGLFPLNIGELLRSDGYEVARPKGLEWMEKTVETLAGKLISLTEEERDEYLRGAAKTLLKKHPNQKHVRWAFADACDRVTLRQYQASLLDTYLDNIA